MNNISRKLLPVLLGALVISVAGCASKAGMPDDKMQSMSDDKMQGMSDDKMMGMSDDKMQGMPGMKLSGDHEVPPVDTEATGHGAITVAADKSVSGSIMTTGVEATAAHIHEGAAGSNGPVVISLKKSADDAWVVPPGAMLTDAQYASYMAGNLYVNVHSAAHTGGEIRAQLSPK